MTHTGIECFLAICRCKTGSAAADSLYITQPSLSARLKVLEQEVGTQLFYRRKGSREMILTSAGQEFYQLAVQYESVIEQMHKLGNDRKATLQISCFNSLGTYLLPSVYNLFLQTNPSLNLQIQDMDIHSATQSILLGETDLALTSGHISGKGLSQFPAFSEPMVLVCAADSQFCSPVSLLELPPDKEVCVHWSQDFANWHKVTLGYTQPKLCVSFMAQLRQFLEQENHWAIVPISVAKGLATECPVIQLATDTPLPFREISCVVGTQTQAPALEAFLSCLRQVLATYPEIRILL